MTTSDDQAHRRRATRRRAGVALAVVVVVALTIGIANRADRKLAFWVQDAIYGNVPSFVSCSDAPSRAMVDAALAKGTPWDHLEPSRVTIGPWPIAEDCREKAQILIRYGGRSEQEVVEAILWKHGLWDHSVGWHWNGIPVALRNE